MANKVYGKSVRMIILISHNGDEYVEINHKNNGDVEIIQHINMDSHFRNLNNGFRITEKEARHRVTDYYQWCKRKTGGQNVN